jgi:hypothetical protein
MGKGIDAGFDVFKVEYWIPDARYWMPDMA